ncbi:ATP-dependent DNA helicase PIF1-like protein, partial [Tanacetum coccineum]
SDILCRNNHADRPSLSNILHTSVMIHSDTIIRRDGTVQSFCGLKLSDIGKKWTTKKARKPAALSSTGTEVSFHNLGALTYQCRGCNAVMCRIDHSINVGMGLYTFHINGKNYYRIGSLLPKEGTQPRYAQQWFFDTHNEIRNRLGAFIDQDNGDGVDEIIVGSLIKMLDQNSAIAKAFRMVRDRCHSHVSVNVELRLLSKRTNSRQYNAPTVAEVAALITNDFGNGEPTRDIVVNKKDSRPKRISELHPSYMALQYPLLFPYGEDGYHDKIAYHTNTGKRKTNRDYVTMKEYYAYVIQYRKEQGMTLLRGERLYQQYLVDEYTTIEEQRLTWTRNNQDMLRVDLYHNMCDVVIRGDTNATGLGKRIVLPHTFTGNPRYMMQNYQDAMALCRAYGNPDLFITFTSNPKWLEISKMPAYILGQRAHDRLEVGTKVFKLKLTELLNDLTKNQGVTPEKVIVVDEIKNYLNCRYLAPCEAVTLRDSECLPALLEREGINVTMFTDWFALNERHPSARTLTYAEILKHYVWHEPSKMRPRTFEELLTVNKRLYTTFKEACFAYDLLNDDREWTRAIQEESLWALGPQLCDMFITILLFCDVSHPLKLWEENWEALSEDILHKKRSLFKYLELQLMAEQIQNYCLVEIQELLKRNGRTLIEF